MRFPALLLAFLLLITMPASAQDKVSVRTGAHDAYTRVVFEWPAKTDYSLSKEGGRILIRFAKAGNPDLSGMTAGDPNIKGVQTLSAAGEPLQMAIAIPDGGTFRDLTVQNKVILDIYKPQAGTPPAEASSPPEEEKVAQPTAAVQAQPTVPPAAQTEPAAQKTAVPAPAPTPAAQAKATAPATQPLQENTKAEAPAASPPQAAAPVQTAETVQAAPVLPVEEKTVPEPRFDPHFVTMTATSNLGIAAYERNGALYIVTDSPDVDVDPLLSGPQKDKMPPMQKFPVPGGVGYKIDLPKGMHVSSVNGGGLSWKIALSEKPAVDEPIPASVVADVSGQGGALSWPLQDMRKVLTFTDPVVGDKVVAVTADDAAQATGEARGFVNLDTLDSRAGLAFVPKSDNIKASIGTDSVSIAQPGGFNLSPVKATQVQSLRNATQETPPELPNPADNLDKPADHAPADAAQEASHAPPEEVLAAAADSQKSAANVDAEKTEEHDNPLSDHAAVETPVHEQEHTEPAAHETQASLASIASAKPSGNNIYNFQKWEGGGIQALENNLHLMMVDASTQKPENRVQDMLTMAKLNLANGRGAEAIGLLRMALQQVPDLANNEEFQALRAAAFALSGKYDEALEGYGSSDLQNYDDVKLWRAYTLAGLEDWKQAIATLPSDISAINGYPSVIRTPLALSFAEIQLRSGKVGDAQNLLDGLAPTVETMSLPYKSALAYLEGEAARQLRNPEKAVEVWTPLVKNGKDDLYRAKAGLSLTKLQIEQKAIKPDEAINRLEGLRYAWRGDELETLVNYRLAQMYIDNKDYLKGLTVLRSASNLSPGTDLNKSVRDYMVKTYRDIFANNRLDTLSPLEAISVYEEFKNLAPAGAEGDAYVEKLAERLVNAELLGRAAALLNGQIKNRLQGDKKAEVSIRLAAIQLLDGNPAGALRSLDIAQDTLNKIGSPAATKKPDAKEDAKKDSKAEGNDQKTESKTSGGIDPEKQRQILLLKARALSMLKKPDDAMAILDKMRLDADVNKLRTDIAWTAGKWEDAADALNDLLMDENIALRGELTPYQRDILLNQAIALNLSGNRVGLANLRNRYGDLMDKTPKGKLFDVVTRPRRPDMIGSREAIQSMISEIDLFKGFLDGYATMDADKKAAKDVAPVSGGNNASPPAAQQPPAAASAPGSAAAPAAPAAQPTTTAQ